MDPAQLSVTVVDAVASLVDDGRLVLPDGVPTRVPVERPRTGGHGDYATNVALRLAEPAGTSPRALGELLARRLRTADGITAVDVTGPGFLNITVAPPALGRVAADVVEAGERYGASDRLAGRRVDLGPVAVGPTSPPDLADARRAVVDDALGRILALAGAEVTRGGSTVDHADDHAVDHAVDHAATAAMADLVDVVGADAARYALVRTSAQSDLRIDLDLWARRSDDNPVFLVQHAHAEVSGLLRRAADLGALPASHPGLLTHVRERDLLAALAELPRVVTSAAERRAPHRVAHHLEELARTFHRFDATCRVLPQGDEETTDLHRARLLLVDATRVVLATGLGLLGVTAPERW